MMGTAGKLEEDCFAVVVDNGEGVDITVNFDRGVDAIATETDVACFGTLGKPGETISFDSL